MQWFTVVPIIFFVILGIITVVLGIFRYQKQKNENEGTIWYKQTYIMMGITCFFLAVFFFLIGLHDSISESNEGLRNGIFVFAFVFIIGAIIPCFYMVRGLILTSVRHES